MISFYWYPGCSTCRKAKQALEENKIAFKAIDITEQPPTLAMLRGWLKNGTLSLKELLNTSGQDYRALGMAQRVRNESTDQILKQLAGNGRLIKRPILSDGKRATAGFRDPAAIVAFWKN